MKSFFQFLTAAQSQASMQAKKLNLVSDGHGGWLDSRGKFVATTEDGKLKFVDKKKKKAEDEPTARPRAAKPEPNEKQSYPFRLESFPIRNDFSVSMLEKTHYLTLDT